MFQLIFLIAEFSQISTSYIFADTISIIKLHFNAVYSCHFDSIYCRRKSYK